MNQTTNPAKLYHQAIVAHKSANTKLAINLMSQVTKLDPSNANAHYMLGFFFLKNNQTELAKHQILTTLSLKSLHPQALYHLAVIYDQDSQTQSATTALQQSLSLKPDNQEAYKLLIQLLKPSFPQLARIYQHIMNQFSSKPNLKLPHAPQPNNQSPTYANSIINLWDLAQQTNNFKLSAKLKPLVINLTKYQLKHSTPPTLSPLLSLTLDLSPSQQLKLLALHSGSTHTKPTHSYSTSKKLKIGYLSANFSNHSVGHLIYPLFKLHSNKLTTYAISTSPSDQSRYYKRIKKHADHFIDASTKTPDQVANQIKKLKLHLLIDLTGHTHNQSPQILGHHPTPISLNYLGYPGTLGDNLSDYIITDPILTPPTASESYSESFLYLPHSYQINHQSSNQSIAEKTKSSFNYICLNRPQKFDQSLLKAWSKILKETEESNLVLSVLSIPSRNNITDFFTSHGIDKSRIIFLPQQSLNTYYSILQNADLALDPFIYSGGATTSNNLKSLLPTITLIGNKYLNRMSASLLTASGLPELITHSPAHYCDLAISLHHQRHKLASLKTKLQLNLQTYPLFDTSRFVANLESAYIKVLNNNLTANQPSPISILDPYPLDRRHKLN